VYIFKNIIFIESVPVYKGIFFSLEKVGGYKFSYFGTMPSQTAIRFYDIQTHLTEAVLPDTGSGNYKTIVSL
jgi:hypothetical protein